MRLRWMMIGLIGLGLAGTGCSQMKKDKDEEKEGPEVSLTLDKVPDAVKATLTKEAEGAAFTSVDQETDDGKTVYETDVTLYGKIFEIKVADDGSLISKKIDDDGDNEKKD